MSIEGRPTQPKNPESSATQEKAERLHLLFDQAEKVFEVGGRDPAKPLLNEIYNTLIELNKYDKASGLSMSWNKEGDLSEVEFNEFDLRRKKLSNAIGIMAKRPDGTIYIRHDLNDLS